MGPLEDSGRLTPGRAAELFWQWPAAGRRCRSAISMLAWRRRGQVARGPSCERPGDGVSPGAWPCGEITSEHRKNCPRRAAPLSTSGDGMAGS